METQRDKSGHWSEYANCSSTDPEVFFPESETQSASKAAKEICSRCIVRDECLDYALSNNENSGIWGGYTSSERDKLKRSRRSPRSYTAY